jgi:hemerythrin-like domain-containing protein
MSSLNENDPIHRHAEKDMCDNGFSPMDPPDAYDPPGKVDIAVEDMHPFLQQLVADHVEIKKALSVLEETLIEMKSVGVTKTTNGKLAEFFRVFNEVFIPHDKREEKSLFPLLEAKLIEKGEHSQGAETTTAVDVMEADHIRAIQLASVAFNFFGLASRLVDEGSRNIVLDVAISQSEDLIELLRLHIFREDSIVFPLAEKYVNKADLDRLQKKCGCSHV